MNSHHTTAIIIAGPTAVGKTAIAIDLSQRLHTEILSADSRQCYREMSIGTAKPGEADLAAVPHHFIGSHSIAEELTAADYEQLALHALDGIFRTRDTAVICGGTGLYIKALCEGLDEMPAADAGVAAAVNAAYVKNGLPWLQAAIAAEDPAFYASGEVQNPARLLRALVFIRSAGESILKYRSGAVKQRPFSIVKIGLELPRPVLYERINKRVDQMMQQGLLEEVKTLYPQRSLKNLNTVGYSELFDYLDGKLSLDAAVDKIRQHTRNYAKRQLTWFKKDPGYHWLQADDAGVVTAILERAAGQQ